MRRLSPYIRWAQDWHSAPDENWHLARRVIFDYEIIQIREGEVNLITDKCTYEISPGDFVVLRPKMPHEFVNRTGGPVNQPHVHFDMVFDELSSDVYINFKDLPNISDNDQRLFRTDILDELMPDFPTVIRPAHSSEPGKKLMELIHEVENRELHYGLAAEGLLMQLITMLIREASLCGGVPNKPQELARSAQQYLNDHIDQDVSLDELAEYAHVSKYYLCRIFKSVYGVSPIRYHRESKIIKARELLINTSLPIKAIAEMTGFQSIFSFSRAFKNAENVSPSVYRS